MNGKEKETVSTWEDVWGDDAIHDLAEDLENTYERSLGKSSVYWGSKDLLDPIGCHDELEGRPNDYDSYGYTADFEAWGIEMTSKAIEGGCNSVEEVFANIIENNKPKN